MEQSEIYSRISKVMRTVFDDDSITATPEMTAKDVKDWDSVNHVNLIFAMEREFKVRFKTAEVEKMKNVGQMAESLQAKLA
jgi:acyl carrier protein